MVRVATGEDPPDYFRIPNRPIPAAFSLTPPCTIFLAQQRNTLDGWVIRKARPGQQLRTSGRTTRGAGRGHAYKGIIDVSGAGVPAHMSLRP